MEFKPTIKQRILAVLAGQFSAVYSQTIPNFKLYGGATITRTQDDLGNVYRAMCARNLVTNQFGLFIFKNGQNIPSPRAPIPFATGRGSINRQGWWLGFDGETYNEGQIPTWNE